MELPARLRKREAIASDKEAYRDTLTFGHDNFDADEALCIEWLFNTQLRPEPQMGATNVRNYRREIVPLNVKIEDWIAGHKKNFERVKQESKEDYRERGLLLGAGTDDDNLLKTTNTAFSSCYSYYWLIASTLNWCGLSFENYALNEQVTPKCAPDDARIIPTDVPVRFETMADLNRMQMTYKSDAQEFFRVALSDRDSEEMEPVVWPLNEVKPRGRPEEMGIMVAANGQDRPPRLRRHPDDVPAAAQERQPTGSAEDRVRQGLLQALPGLAPQVRRPLRVAPGGLRLGIKPQHNVRPSSRPRR